MGAQSNKRKKRLTNIVFYMLFVLIFQEMAFRLCFPIPEIQNLDRANYNITASGYTALPYKRDQDLYWQSSLDTPAVFEHQMNRYGFRDKEWIVEKESGKKRVLFIGDSFVEGVMADQDETITTGFERASSTNQYEVMNAGMVGMGLDSYLQLLADIVPIYKPEVVFLCLYANDLGQNEPAVPQLFLSPEYYNIYKPRLLEVIDQLDNGNGLLFRWDNSTLPLLPEGNGNPWIEHEDLMTPHVAPEHAKKMKKGTFNPFRANAFAEEERNLKLQPALGETVPLFKYICDQNDVEPIIVYIPTRNQVTKHYYQYELELCLIECNDSTDLTTPKYQLHQKVLKSQCTEVGIQFIDLSDFIKEKEAKNQHLYWNYDEHMRGKGYLILGNAIWNKWQK